jgi:hypothetical protein
MLRAQWLIVTLALAGCGGGKASTPAADPGVDADAGVDAGGDASQSQTCSNECTTSKDCPSGETCCSPLPTQPPTGCSSCGHACPAASEAR